MKRLSLLLFIAFFGFYAYGQTSNSWTKKASFGGLKREKAVAFSIDSYGYVSCGVDTAEQVHNDLWQYNPELDAWTQLASLPGVARKNAIAFVIAGKAYLGTGYDHDETLSGSKLKDFWEYNPLENEWTEKAHYPGGGDTGIYQATAFTLLEKGYVACGKIGPDAYIPELWQYDPLTDSWIERTPFPGGDRYQLISFVLENKAFVGMGTDHDVFRKDIWEYDPVTNTWEDRPDFPGTERAQSTTFSIGSKAFVVFGTDGGLKDELWEYSYYSQSWNNRAPFPGGGRKNGIAFSIGNKGYVGLGKESDGKRRSFYEYTPAGPLSVVEENNFVFSFYPNPTVTNAYIELPQLMNKGTIIVVALNGKIMKKHTFDTHQFAIDVSNLNKGTYQLVVLDQYKGVIGSKPIVIG